MSKYVFTTLALGPVYTYKVRTLIDTVLLFTTGDVMIVTDRVNEIEEYVTTTPNLDPSRVKIIDYHKICDKDIWFSERQFNFNLKILPTKCAYEHGGYDMIIHSDADGFLIGWDETDFQRFITDAPSGLLARFRNRPGEEGAMAFLITPKATQLSLDIDKLYAPMPIEVFMMFKPDCPEFPKFIEEWVAITDRCYGRGVNPFIEALEISYALSMSALPTNSLLNYYTSHPVLQCLRYLHQDKIMRIV